MKELDPGDFSGLKMDEGEAEKLLQRGTVWVAEEQEILYAQDRWSLFSSSRRWMRAEPRMRQSKHADVRCKSTRLPGLLVQASHRLKTSTTILCGATPSACQGEWGRNWYLQPVLL